MLKIQEFLHLLSKVLGNIKTMLARVQVIKRLNLKNKIQLNLIFFYFLKSINKIITTVVDSAAGVKTTEENQADNLEM